MEAQIIFRCAVELKFKASFRRAEINKHYNAAGSLKQSKFDDLFCVTVLIAKSPYRLNIRRTNQEKYSNQT